MSCQEVVEGHELREVSPIEAMSKDEAKSKEEGKPKSEANSISKGTKRKWHKNAAGDHMAICSPRSPPRSLPRNQPLPYPSEQPFIADMEHVAKSMADLATLAESSGHQVYELLMFKGNDEDDSHLRNVHLALADNFHGRDPRLLDALTRESHLPSERNIISGGTLVQAVIGKFIYDKVFKDLKNEQSLPLFTRRKAVEFDDDYGEHNVGFLEEESAQLQREHGQSTSM